MCIVSPDISTLINGRLSSRYCDALRRTENHFEIHGNYSTCLAEYRGPLEHQQRSPTSSEQSFEAKFCCPNIHFISDHEVILFLNLQEGYYGKEASSRKTIYCSKFAFRVPISPQTCPCKSRKLLYTLEIQSADFVEKHSNLPEDMDEHLAPWVGFLINSYLPTLKDAGYHEFQFLPSQDQFLTNIMKPPGSLDLDAIQKDILGNTHTGDFDMVLALTQKYINSHLKSLWNMHEQRTREARTRRQQDACHTVFSFKSSHGEDFSAMFEAPHVQLVHKEEPERAIIYLCMNVYLKTGVSEGTLQSRFDGYERLHFAFEVELDIVHIDSTSFGQVILRLSSGKNHATSSSLLNVLNDTHKICTGLEELIKTQYFPEFQRANCHVLYTIPWSLPGRKDKKQLSTPVSFKIIPFDYTPNIRNPNGGLYCPENERNAIVIGISYGYKPEASNPSLPHVGNWIYGALYLSRTVFLEGFLLEMLERVNRETTIVPRFFAVENGGWELHFETLGGYEAADGVPCKWKTEGKKITTGNFEYEWNCTEKDICRHESGHFGSKENVATCLTRNVITFPIGPSQSKILQIRLTGTVELLHDQGSSRESSNPVTVTWSATIELRTTFTSPKIEVHYDEPHSDWKEDDAVKKIFSQLRSKLDGLNFIIDEWRNELEETWKTMQVQECELHLAHPMLNQRGDLVMELNHKNITENRGQLGGTDENEVITAGHSPQKAADTGEDVPSSPAPVH